MIERVHMRAMKIALDNAEKARSSGDLDAVRSSERQADAFAELEQARRTIFERHGVNDITEGAEELAELSEEERIKKLSLGESIQYYRGKKGYTQEEFAERSGTSRVTVSRSERGETTPSVYLLKNYMNAFGWPEQDQRRDFLLERANEQRNPARKKDTKNQNR